MPNTAKVVVNLATGLLALYAMRRIRRASMRGLFLGAFGTISCLLPVFYCAPGLYFGFGDPAGIPPTLATAKCALPS